MEFSKCILYAVIINMMGSLSYWYSFAIKDILKVTFGAQFEFEVTDLMTWFYQFFLIGEILSGLLWTALLKYMSTRTCILVSLAMQALTYFIQTQFTSLGALFFCRIIQGFFNNVNSLGKAYVFEFADVDYIGYAFSSKGFLSIVLANFFP